MTREEVLAVACPRCARGVGKPCKSTPGIARIRLGLGRHYRTGRYSRGWDPRNRGQASATVHIERFTAAGRALATTTEE